MDQKGRDRFDKTTDKDVVIDTCLAPNKKRFYSGRTLTALAVVGFAFTTLIALSITLYKTHDKLLDELKVQHVTALKLKGERDSCLKEIVNQSEKNKDDLQKYITYRFSSVPAELASIIANKTEELCKEHNMAFNLIAGLMEVESGFNPFAKSKVGARGLLQVMFKTWNKTYKIEKSSDLHDIHLGLETGIQILKHYLAKNKGDVTQALQNYNGAKGRDFSNSVYIAVGKFSAFRNNTYQTKVKGDKQNGTKTKDRGGSGTKG